MIPQAVQLTLPSWIQLLLAAVAILANLATAAFVLFVLWPSIRNQERRAERLEEWLDRQEVKDAIWKLVDKVSHGDGLGSQRVDKSEWTKGIRQEGDL